MLRFLIVFLVGLLLAACSSTTMSGSWSDPDYEGKIKTVYLIGMSKNETNRRIFEDTFNRQLTSNGVKAISSYTDMPNSESADREKIKKMMSSNGADSVLLTNLVNQRTEKVTTPGRVYSSNYSSTPYYRNRPTHYNNWGRYYNRPTDITYQPPSTDTFVVLTVESVLYDLKTEKLIWSAQLETLVEGNIESMIQDFVKTVTKDLKSQGLM